MLLREIIENITTYPQIWIMSQEGNNIISVCNNIKRFLLYYKHRVANAYTQYTFALRSEYRTEWHNVVLNLKRQRLYWTKQLGGLHMRMILIGCERKCGMVLE